VKAQVMGIHFARTRRGETEKILEGLRQRVPECKNVNYRSVAKLLPKPYPDHEGVANAYRLCCMKDPETEEQSPMALWDLHYLRELDDSGFIDEIYKCKRQYTCPFFMIGSWDKAVDNSPALRKYSSGKQGCLPSVSKVEYF